MTGLRLPRRELLLGGLCLCTPALAAGSSAGVVEVAPGVFIRRGVDADASRENADGIANSGFMVGDQSVLVTDPGGSHADGAWLRAEIRKRTDKPIRHVVLPHVHPDHIFGASAFVADAPEFIGHHRLRAALAARGEYYRARLAEIVGVDAAGSVVLPTREITAAASIDIGGRSLDITACPVAHTDCDLTLQDRRAGIFFPGDLLFVGRIPSLDGSLLGWLEQLAGFTPGRAVPGHGPVLVDLVPAVADLTRYLTILRDETRAAIAANVGIQAAVATVGRSERGRWTLFDEYHGHNVTQAYKELEWE